MSAAKVPYRTWARRCIVAAGLVTLSTAVTAETLSLPSAFGVWGTPGLIDMPSAQSAPDGELSFSSAHFAGTLRNTLTFQIAPRLSGSFRYSTLENYQGSGTTLFDRSFDLRFRVLEESRFLPDIAVGLQDFIGTGAYSAEYIVATKTLSPGVSVTGGLGWGRLGSFGGIGLNSTRPAVVVGVGGTFRNAAWFQGDAAPFGGISWDVNDRLTLKAEYSSDAYSREVADGQFTRRSPYNFGLSYRLGESTWLGLAYLYGDTVGVSLTFSVNPNRPSVVGTVEPAPAPLRIRPTGSYDTAWIDESPRATRQSLQARLAPRLAEEGLILEAFDLSATQAEIRFRNLRYDTEAQAFGRVARALSHVLPGSVETFVLIPVVDGMALSRVIFRRSDLERFEHAPDGARRLYQAAAIEDAGGANPDSEAYDPTLYPRFRWGLGPYIETELFDPDAPLRADLGLSLTAQYDFAPGLSVSGEVRQNLIGNLNSSTRASNSVLPRVRSETNIYSKSQTSLSRLTADYRFRPGTNLYGRVSAGYLESQFGGVSTELLWKPVDSRWALGAEANYVRQRDFDQGFGFRSYETFTGHVSAYWDLSNGYHAQLDVGQYLAGDLGATLTLDREFANGWRVGAYATLTDVPFSQFGEGSFDKGIRLSIPLSWGTGSPNRSVSDAVIQPILRDGGARLKIHNRLYEDVRDYHVPRLSETWGRVWR